MGEFFYRLYNLIQHEKRLSIAALMCVFGILIWTASGVTFTEDIAKLIPSSSDNQDLQKILKTAHFSDKIIVHLQKEMKGDTEDLADYATQFLDTLTATSEAYIKDIQGKIDEETIFETMDFVYDHVPLFLNEDDYKTLSAKLTPDSLAKIMENTYKTLISPSGIVVKKTLLKDPLGISLMALKHLQKLGVSKEFTLKDGFLISKDEQHLLLFITPEFPSNNTTQNAIFSNELYKIQEHLNTIYHDKVGASYFGGPLIAVANAQQIKNDIQITVTIAMIFLMTVFILFYKKLAIPFILFVPTLFGGLLAIGVLSILRGEISAISMGIGAVLLGVTLDYSLHILTHIRNKETARTLFLSISKPILMSSLTTAMAFLCLVFVEAQALQDLGIFAAVSVMGSSIFALIFIPQMYHGINDNTSRRSFFDNLASYRFHKNKIFIGIIGILLLMSAFTYPRVVFNHDISNLNFIPPTIKSAEARLDKLIKISSKSLYVIAYGTNEQEVLESNDSVFEQLQKLEDQHRIASYSSVATLVNSNKKQRQAIQKWDNFWTPERKHDTKRSVTANAAKLGFKATSFSALDQLLEDHFQPLTIDDYKQMNVLPVDDFIAKSSDFMTVTSVITMADGHIEAVKKTFKDMPNVMLIDRQAINETLLGHVKKDFNNVLMYCFIAVIMLLLLFYQNLKLTMVTAVPIIITWFITIGLMGLFQLEFNIFNIIISAFIFGLGVDYSIFMTNGMRSGLSSMQTHKTSIILSVLTTILGVGVLIFAKHPALHSLAAISVIGILSAMFITFTIQPILYKVMIKKSKSSADQRE